jgi:hypothetical protein
MPCPRCKLGICTNPKHDIVECWSPTLPTVNTLYSSNSFRLDSIDSLLPQVEKPVLLFDIRRHSLSRTTTSHVGNQTILLSSGYTPKSVLVDLPSIYALEMIKIQRGGYDWIDIIKSKRDIKRWIVNSIHTNLHFLESPRLLLSTFENLVVFPVVARGDMNAYKYINCGRNGKRVFTILAINDKPNEKKGLLHNNNLSSHMQHLTSTPTILEFDYVVLPLEIALKFKAEVEKIKKDFTVKYDTFDELLYKDQCLVAAQAELSKIRIGINGVINQVENDVRRAHLVIININSRITIGAPYDARNQRHSTDPSILKAMMEMIDSNDSFDLMITGEELPFVTLIPYINCTQLWDKGLNRFEQRSLMHQMCKKYSSTVYIGMQSGVNEDAVLLHKTNVFSICENLPTQQVGLSRVNAKMTQHNRLEETPYNNFFVIKNTSFLTPVGQLAAHQLAKNPLRDHTLTYNEFTRQIIELREQLVLLEVDSEDIVKQFSSRLLDTGYEVQSDDESDDDDELDDDILISKSGREVVKVLSPQQQKYFKRLRVNNVSRNNTLYTKLDDGRYLRRTSGEPINTVGSEQSVSCDQLISNIESNSDGSSTRADVIKLVIHNILTITNRRDVDETEYLFNAMFINMKLLNSKLCLNPVDNQSIRIMPKPVLARRQSKTYRPGFYLSEMNLQTKQQQDSFLDQVAVVEDDSDSSGSEDDDIFGDLF